MPLYEYECRKCNRTDLKILKIDHDPPRCERCGTTMEKQVSEPAPVHSSAGEWRR